MAGKIRDIKDKKVNYEDAPEDFKDTGTMEDSSGTCAYCGQSRFVKIFPGENPDTVATRECECSEARQERELQNTIHATKKGMDKRLKNISNRYRYNKIRTHSRKPRTDRRTGTRAFKGLYCKGRYEGG